MHVEFRLYVIGRMGVPIFMMLTGALLLQKDIKDIKEFYMKKLLPLIVTYGIWTLFYIMYACKYWDEEFSILMWIRQTLCLKRFEVYHFWYMPVIMGIYIVVPFLGKFVRSYSNKVIIGLMSISFCTLSVMPLVNKILLVNKITEGALFEPYLDINFLGGIYGIYILLGYLIVHRGILQKINTSILILALASCFLLVSLLQYQMYITDTNYLGNYLWYDSPFLIISGATLFEMIMRMKDNIPKKMEKVCKDISERSFGMYCVHVLILWKFKSSIMSLNTNIPIKIIICFICVVIVSYIVVDVLKSIRLLKKLYIKL